MAVSTKQRKTSERSLANLKPYKPGQSGNPSGKPKGTKSITKVIREMLDNGMDGKDVAKLMAKTGIKSAIRGHFQFWKEIIDRTDGKVSDQLDVTTGGQSLTFNLIEAATKKK